MRVSLVAGFFYFLIVGAAGIFFGMLREMFLTPSLGKAIAVLVELPIMLLIAWYSCGLLLRWNRVPQEIVPRLVVGVTAFTLLMAMEQALQFVVRTLVISTSESQALTLADYFGLAGQIAFALFPLFVSADTEPETETDHAAVFRRGRARVPTRRQ